ncbi:cation diffusion facilitator family transporter [Thalassotalea sp. HSM 43]|uniref:cation diffusion facilitator family transporter n=1 Tax=Thalassotalea sp. HSM 43 TaxID=2552945 RepID=UPI001679C445|nr:cation transporter [Thalassotalea sp. HSM 43]
MTEQTILKICVFTTAAFAILGVCWGLYAGSGMVLFDGIYSTISLLLSLVSLLVLKQIQSANEDMRFPFGKAHFEPLIILFKSLIVIGVCLFSSIDAVLVVLEGGRNVAIESALIYAIISTIGCFIIFMFLLIKNRSIGSKLLNAEKNQWFGDTVLSVGVLAGFSVSLLLRDSQYSQLIPYADPVMVVIASCLFILMPMKTLLAAGKEILYYQVSDDQLQPIDDEASTIAKQLNAQYKLRMVSIGREVNIELNFLMSKGLLSIAEMDAIRNRISQAAEQLNEQHWVNVNFTACKTWL